MDSYCLISVTNSDAFITCNAMWVKLLMLFCSYKKSG